MNDGFRKVQYNLFLPLMCVLLMSLTNEVTKVKMFNNKCETGDDRQIHSSLLEAGGEL